MAPSWLLAGALATSAAAAPIETVPVATGLKHPWSMAFLPGGDFLVSEKEGGLVRVTRDGAKFPVAGMPNDLDNVRRTRADNSGLFDIVLHPDFAKNRRVYFTYAAKDAAGNTTTRLSTARLDGDALVDTRSLHEAIPYTGDRFHYGGALLIDRDRYLYLAVGERHFHERDNPPLPSAQDPGDPRGKIYRFTLDGEPAAGNPDFGDDAAMGLYATGIRASQGMAQDPGTGRIWLSEHGPTGGDELNILRPRANYGWPVKTAGQYRNSDYRPGQTLRSAIFTAPAWTWTDRTVAPTGMTFYQGSQFPQWRGDLLVTGLSKGYLMRVDVDGDKVLGVDYLMTGTRLRNVKQAADGALYLLTDEPEGKILRVERGGNGDA